jgi:hypothetical protein
MRILILFFIVLGSVCHAELRTWTSIVGTKVEAELVSLTGNQVTLKTKAGKTLKLPLNKLSKADQEFLTAKPSLEEIPVKALHYEVEGDDVTITNYLYWEQFEGKQRVAHGLSGKGSGAWAIPKLIKGKAVTHIGADAFNTESMSHLEVPNSVVKIERRAFYGMEYLNSIVIGAGVESIGNQAFWFSKRLAAVTFLGDAPKAGERVFYEATPTIYRKPDAKGWGDTFGGRPVKLISEKP